MAMVLTAGPRESTQQAIAQHAKNRGKNQGRGEAERRMRGGCRCWDEVLFPIGVTREGLQGAQEGLLEETGSDSSSGSSGIGSGPASVLYQW